MKTVANRILFAVALATVANTLPAQNPSAGAPASAAAARLEGRGMWVPATQRQVWIEPVTVTIIDAQGREHRIVAQEGYFKTVEIPGYFLPLANEPNPPAPMPAPAAALPAPMAHADSARATYAIQNRDRFQVQVEEVLVIRADGAASPLSLPPDRAISSGQQLAIALPENSAQVRVRYKKFDYGNKRFTRPVFETVSDARAGGVLLF
jgi:hypothetical protein